MLPPRRAKPLMSAPPAGAMPPQTPGYNAVGLNPQARDQLQQAADSLTSQFGQMPAPVGGLQGTADPLPGQSDRANYYARAQQRMAAQQGGGYQASIKPMEMQDAARVAETAIARPKPGMGSEFGQMPAPVGGVTAGPAVQRRPRPMQIEGDRPVMGRRFQR